MATGYPGSGFFEKIGEPLPKEILDKLIDDSTEEENKEFKKTFLQLLDENLELRYKLMEDLLNENI